MNDGLIIYNAPVKRIYYGEKNNNIDTEYNVIVEADNNNIIHGEIKHHVHTLCQQGKNTTLATGVENKGKGKKF